MYLLRLDDASEHWNRPNWLRMHDLLDRYNVKPLVALIPDNEDPKLLQYPEDPDYWETIHAWLLEGWVPGLHGFNHVLDSKNGGLNPVNQRSEFAGKPIEVQKQKIRDGMAVMERNGIKPDIFVAPAHTFDANTLEALRAESGICVISDTVARDIYFRDGFWFIPQQSGQVRKMGFPIVTFCYHPNTMKDEQFKKLELFLKAIWNQFISTNEVGLKKRNLSVLDHILKWGYFTKRRLRSN